MTSVKPHKSVRKSNKVSRVAVVENLILRSIGDVKHMLPPNKFLIQTSGFSIGPSSADKELIERKFGLRELLPSIFKRLVSKNLHVSQFINNF